MKYKALTVWQPWASLINLGLKQYETRSWRTNHRGKLVICSAQKSSKQQRQQYQIFASKYQIEQPWELLPFGCAITICNLTACIKISDDFLETISYAEMDCGDWQVDRYAWKLENIKAFRAPFPVKGQQGLWNLDSVDNCLTTSSFCISDSITTAMAKIKLGSDQGVQLELSTDRDSKTAKAQAIERYLDRGAKDSAGSSRTFTHESTENDSCVNPQLCKIEHEDLLSYLTQKNTTQRKYGSGWLSLTKAGGTARTDNKYLVYYYRVHWRKRPYAVHIGNHLKNEVLEIALDVRLAIDRDQPPLEIEKMIKNAKNNSN